MLRQRLIGNFVHRKIKIYFTALELGMAVDLIARIKFWSAHRKGMLHREVKQKKI